MSVPGVKSDRQVEPQSLYFILCCFVITRGSSEHEADKGGCQPPCTVAHNSSTAAKESPDLLGEGALISELGQCTVSWASMAHCSDKCVKRANSLQSVASEVSSRTVLIIINSAPSILPGQDEKTCFQML